MDIQKRASITGVLILMGALHAAACTATVVVEDGAGGKGGHDAASSGQGQGGFGECAGILGLSGECPPECEEKRVLCHPEKGPVDESEEGGWGVRLCFACQTCDNRGGWMCSYGI